MKKIIIATIILCLAFANIPFQLDSVQANGSSALERVTAERTTGGLKVDGAKGFFQSLVYVTQEIGVDVTIFFVLLGSIVMVIAIGLNHPEYNKWGRYTIIFGGGMFFVIKLLPIIMHSI